MFINRKTGKENKRSAYSHSQYSWNDHQTAAQNERETSPEVHSESVDVIVETVGNHRTDTLHCAKHGKHSAWII